MIAPGSADEFRQLFDYDRWADRRVLDAVSALEPDELTRDLGGSHPSVRATLAHILGADWIWLERCRGRSPAGFPDGWDLSTFDALVARWRRVEEARRDFVEGLDDADLRRTVSYRNTKGAAFENPLWQLLRHQVNHASYHRGQVVTMLRQLGAEPVSTDLILYHRERAGAPGSGRPGRG